VFLSCLYRVLWVKVLDRKWCGSIPSTECVLSCMYNIACCLCVCVCVCVCLCACLWQVCLDPEYASYSQRCNKTTGPQPTRTYFYSPPTHTHTHTHTRPLPRLTKIDESVQQWNGGGSLPALLFLTLAFSLSSERTNASHTEEGVEGSVWRGGWWGWGGGIKMKSSRSL